MSESNLVVRAQEGDEAAWQSLVYEHQAAVFRLAYLILHDAADAEDVAQDAFIRAFRALDRFDSSRPLRPWLLKITLNLARNKRRALGRYLAAIGRLFQATPKTVVEVERASQQRWDGQILWQAVQRLRPKEQEIIYLRYFLELSEKETAEALGVALGTVKSRRYRALVRLRVVVEQEFPSLQEERKNEQATA